MRQSLLGWLLCLAFTVGTTQAMEVVRQGKAVATIVVASTGGPPQPRRKRASAPSDFQAAQVLVDWIRKMTDAELPITTSAREGSPAIYIGAAAVKAGLRVDDIPSASREGLRVHCEDARLLLAGQSDAATLKSVCRLLEHWGCRYFMDHPLGEVYPRTNTLAIDKLDLTEKPGLIDRKIWGSGWSGGNSLWKLWNGAGGLPFSTQHAWGHYVPKALFAQHPEYFSLRKGQRQAGDWYCTSNPGLREVFARNVISRIETGDLHPSISPPDGRGYCECEACRAQDDPRLIEPSSGQVSVSSRYVDFYQEVAQKVTAANPESILNFYCYADYTQPPKHGLKLQSNLCAWIAPIHYCRFHPIGHPSCPSRVQLQELVDGWAACASKIAYRTYNYNLAEVLVPFSMISVWKHDIPWLKQKGCLGINLETLSNWQIYGPHIYLSIRLAYDPAAEAQAVMDDYFLKFYGPKAGPLMKEYWMGIDQAFLDLRCHAGGFAAIHLVYTPEFLKRCRELIQRAAAAAGADRARAARVQMNAEGLLNAEQYMLLRDAMDRGDFATASLQYSRLLARNETSQRGLGNHYTVDYLKRFISPCINACAAATAPPHKLVQLLPDKWRMAYDDADAGNEKGYSQAGFDDIAWREVLTYGKPLDAQGLADRPTILWYRASINVEQALGKPSLLFLEVDGQAEVYVNGQAVGRSEKKRQPFEVDASRAFRHGNNLVAVRVDHRTMTELFLGGIIRPVILIDKEPQANR